MDFREALLQEMQSSKTKLVENRKIREESKIVEDTEEFLEPRFDSRASFYKKAKVVKKDNGDEELYSYNTHVGGMRGGKPYTKGTWSQTTSRHQREYFKQRGFDPKEVELEEGKKLQEDSYESGIYYEIEEALVEGGLSVTRYTEAGVMSNNIGWEVSGESGSTQLDCPGSYLSEGKKVEEALRGKDGIKHVILERILPDLDLAIELVSEFTGNPKFEGYLNVLEDAKTNIAHGLGEVNLMESKKEEFLDVKPDLDVNISDSTVASGNSSSIDIPLEIPLPI